MCLRRYGTTRMGGGCTTEMREGKGASLYPSKFITFALLGYVCTDMVVYRTWKLSVVCVCDEVEMNAGTSM